MKRNIMLIVVLGLALYGVVAGLGHWASSEDDALGYSTERMVEAAYHAPARTAYTPSAAGNSAVAVPMSDSRGTLFRHTYVPAANYTVSTPMLSGGSYAAQGLMLTLQQRPQSYGGSGSATGTSSSTRMGMGSGSTGGSSYAMGGYASSGSALGGTYISSTPAGGGISVNGNMTSTFSPSVYASAPAPYASFNNDFGTWGNAYNPLDGGVSAIGEAIPSLLGNISRRNVPGIGDTGTAWWNWLNARYPEGKDDLTLAELEQLYRDMTGDNDFSDTYTWQQFLDWFYSKQGTDGFLWKLPLSDALPFVLLLAALWAICIYRRTSKSSQV